MPITHAKVLTVNDEALVMFVAPGGNDSNSGLSPALAKATIQAGYDTLKSYVIANHSGGGTFPVGCIQLLPGDHDVDTGLVFDPRYPVELIGFMGGSNWTAPGDSAARVVSSSSACTELVKVYHASASASNHGFTFRDVAFRVDEAVNTALTKVLYLIETDSLVIERCGFTTVSEKIAATAVYIESRGDSAWHRIRQNWSAGMQFLKFSDSPNATNYNRIIVEGNYSTYDGGPSGWPQYHLAGEVWESVFIANNVEGPATAFLMDGDAGNKGRNVFLNNAGESPNATNPFYDVQRQGGSQFIGGLCTAIGGTGTWINFGDNGYGNIVLGNYTAAGASGYKQGITDTSTYGNQILHGALGLPVKYKSGLDPTITDSVFLLAPPNGTMAVTHGTTSGNDSIWVRSNDAWVRMVEA